MATLKKYPIGIQTFSKIREEDFYYVDKTPFVYKMEEEKSGFYFLSRPRRFGKSLFLDTLRQAYLGKKEYFQGLFLEDHWDWSKSYPVLKLSWGGVLRNPEELRASFEDTLRRWQREHTIEFTATTQAGRFFEILEKLHTQTGESVVLLIDEYDKPILDNIANLEVAKAMREELKNLYSVVKNADEHIKLAFITGVSKFSKVSLFSGLNNLRDISQAPGYGGICGYTQSELESVFAPSLEGLDLPEIKRWYNGYRFGDAEGVYNPFDVLLYLQNREFQNYWFESATPTFLIDMLAQKKFAAPDLENISAGADILGSFEIEKLSLTTLLFQAGYLTIANAENRAGAMRYQLKFPNHEVKQSLSDYLLTYFVDGMEIKMPVKDRIWDAMVVPAKPDFASFQSVFQAFFASIPYVWYNQNRMAEYEG